MKNIKSVKSKANPSSEIVPANRLAVVPVRGTKNWALNRIAILDARLGKDVGAKAERTRLNKLIK